MDREDTDLLVRRYERKVLDPAAWSQFGSSGFYDVGLWSLGATTQQGACEALVDRLASGVGPSPGRVLDVACGAGATTDRFRRVLGADEVLGVDVAPGLVAAARRGYPECGFSVMDATALAFPDGVFDAVTCVEAAFHFRSRRAFLASAARVLRPGGRLVLADLVVAGSDLLGAWMTPPENAMPAADYAGMVAAAGFEDVDVQDETEACWRAYCRFAGAAAPPGHLRDYFAALERDAVQAYVLVTATRRGPRPPMSDGRS